MTQPPIFQPPTAITAVDDLSDGSFDFDFLDIDTGTLPDYSLDDQSAHSPNIESAAEPIRQQHSYSLRNRTGLRKPAKYSDSEYVTTPTSSESD